MSKYLTSRCRFVGHLVVKIFDTKNMKRRISKNNMKIAKKENQNELTMMIRLDCQFPVSNAHSDHTVKLPVIQF